MSELVAGGFELLYIGVVKLLAKVIISSLCFSDESFKYGQKEGKTIGIRAK